MKIQYVAILAIAAFVATGCTQASDTQVLSEQASPSPCAANSCAANPCAAQAALAPAVYSDRQGLAIRGTDPVAYFEAGEAVQGSSSFQHEWNGATWQFSSEENRAKFAADPEQFAPQYGGYCAFAISEGNLVSIDPEAWKIVDGKLYLNYSPGVQAQWSQDIPGRISQADANWPKVLENGTVFDG